MSTFYDPVRVPNQAYKDNERIPFTRLVTAHLLDCIRLDTVKITCIAFNNQRTRFLTATGTMVILWDYDKMTPINKCGRPTAIAGIESMKKCCFSPDGRVFAVCGNDARITIYKTETMLLERILDGHKSIIHDVKFIQDKLYSCGEDGMVFGWDWKTKTIKEKFMIHPSAVHSFDFINRDYIKCFTARADGFITSWDLQHKLLIEQFSTRTSPNDSENGINVLQVSPNARYLAFGQNNGKAQLWQISTYCKSIEQLKLEQENMKNQNLLFEKCINLDSDSIKKLKPVAHLKLGEVPFFDVFKAEFRFEYSHDAPINALCFSRNSEILVTGCANSILKIWSPKKGNMLFQINFPDPIESIQFDFENEMFVSSRERLLKFQVKAFGKEQELPEYWREEPVEFFDEPVPLSARNSLKESFTAVAADKVAASSDVISTTFDKVAAGAFSTSVVQSSTTGTVQETLQAEAQGDQPTVIDPSASSSVVEATLAQPESTYLGQPAIQPSTTVEAGAQALQTSTTVGVATMQKDPLKVSMDMLQHPSVMYNSQQSPEIPQVEGKSRKKVDFLIESRPDPVIQLHNNYKEYQSLMSRGLINDKMLTDFVVSEAVLNRKIDSDQFYTNLKRSNLEQDKLVKTFIQTEYKPVDIVSVMAQKNPDPRLFHLISKGLSVNPVMKLMGVQKAASPIDKGLEIPKKALEYTAKLLQSNQPFQSNFKNFNIIPAVQREPDLSLMITGSQRQESSKLKERKTTSRKMPVMINGLAYSPWGQSASDSLLLRSGIADRRKSNWEQLTRFNESVQFPRAYFREPNQPRLVLKSKSRFEEPSKFRFQESNPSLVRGLSIKFDNQVQQVLSEPLIYRKQRMYTVGSIFKRKIEFYEN